MTDTKKLMRDLGAAISGRLDFYIAREAVKYAKGRDTVTFGEIRANRNNVLGAKND